MLAGAQGWLWGLLSTKSSGLHTGSRQPGSGRLSAGSTASLVSAYQAGERDRRPSPLVWS